MLYIKNLPLWERALRLSAGAGLAAYALLYMRGLPGWALLACGAGVALTGLIGFCPACALAGRRIAKAAEKTSSREAP